MVIASPIDVHWTGRVRSIAACLLEADGQAVLLDPGPTSSLETLRAKLAKRGMTFGSLSAVLLTHIHLDHAGAVGSIVHENPRLPVFVHERGAPHMADPSKLLASAGRLYGNLLQSLYGDVRPVPQENLRVLQGGEKVPVGRQSLEVVYTPGHASHHVSYFDAEGTAYVGDTAGIRIQGDAYLIPATPPPDVDVPLWNASLHAIAERKPARLFLTHFGFCDEPAEHIAAYRECLHRWTSLAGELIRKHGEDDAAASKAFVATIAKEIRSALPSREAEHYLFNGALELSWRGLARYWRKSREAAATA